MKKITIEVNQEELLILRNAIAARQREIRNRCNAPQGDELVKRLEQLEVIGYDLSLKSVKEFGTSDYNGLTLKPLKEE